MPGVSGTESTKMIKDVTSNDPNYFNPYILIHSGYAKHEI
jgi:hypothetical protein